MAIINPGIASNEQEKAKLTSLQWRILVLLLLFYIVDGIDMQILGVTVAAISGDWGLPLSAFSAAMAAGHAGAAVGALIGGTLGDKLGRRPVMIIGALMFGSLTLTMLFATTPSQLVILRFVAGVGLGGGLPPGLALLSECMPARLKNFTVSLVILCAPVGIAISGILASVILPVYGWKTLFIIAGIMPLIVAVLFWFMLPESPAFLAKIPGKKEKAAQLLAKLNLPPIAPDGENGKETKRAGFKDILKKGQLAKSLSLFGLFFISYLSMSMVLSWLPALLSNVGFDESVAGYALALWSLVGMLGVLSAGILMGRYGTRKILGISLAGSIFALAIVAFALPQPGDKASLQLFYILIALGGFMVNSTMTTTIAHAATVFPPDIRSTGIGLSTMWGRIGAISGAFIGATLMEITGANGFFAIVASALLFGFLLFIIELILSRRTA